MLSTRSRSTSTLDAGDFVTLLPSRRTKITLDKAMKESG
jgi:hypothetical protein